ncbi:hypothetical protein FIBSPDRAFT_994265 [Athelia psychrophila]|uniref:Uncharacterized protein n=1 Tax=Athelia psychrophila TaxID=1759441 RepID=A0A166RVQ9_9AGAM|nr:hypothetical protein FIBSPDRAFT_994265 [Fibularhizoctonia sp. CBS 109695]
MIRARVPARAGQARPSPTTALLHARTLARSCFSGLNLKLTFPHRQSYFPLPYAADREEREAREGKLPAVLRPAQQVVAQPQSEYLPPVTWRLFNLNIGVDAETRFASSAAGLELRIVCVGIPFDMVESASHSSSPIFSTAYVLPDSAVEIPAQQELEVLSPIVLTPETSASQSDMSQSQSDMSQSCNSMHGNQLEYYEPYGYPDFPLNAGQQYLSPQCPSPCEKIAMSRTANPSKAKPAALNLNPIASRKRTRNEAISESHSFEDFSTSPQGHVPPPPKRPRVMSEDSDLLVNDSNSAPPQRHTQRRDIFEDRVMNLIQQNLEETRALRREVAIHQLASSSLPATTLLRRFAQYIS